MHRKLFIFGFAICTGYCILLHRVRMKIAAWHFTAMGPARTAKTIVDYFMFAIKQSIIVLFIYNKHSMSVNKI